MDKLLRSFRKIGQAVTNFTADPTPYNAVEMRRAGLALKQYEYCAKKRISDYPVEHLSRLIEEVDVAEEGSLQIFVEGEITRQLIHMFRCIRHDYQSQKNSSIAKSAKFEMPFTLEVKPSKLHEAGDGVFVKVLSSALAPPTGAPASERPYLRPGTVVALYPGLVHLKEHLNENSYLRTLLPDPDYMDDLQRRVRDSSIVNHHSLMPSGPFVRGNKQGQPETYRRMRGRGTGEVHLLTLCITHEGSFTAFPRLFQRLYDVRLMECCASIDTEDLNTSIRDRTRIDQDGTVRQLHRLILIHQ
eukprot:gene16451-11764_t